MQFEEKERSDHAIFLAKIALCKAKRLSLDPFECALQSGPDLESRICSETYRDD
jgi:hypothetical protein